MAALRVARASRTYWTDSLSRRQRRQLIKLLRISRGRPSNLSARQRTQLRELTASLDLSQLIKTLARAALPIGKPTKRKAFRRR